MSIPLFIAGLKRSLSYFDGLRITRNSLSVRNPGTRIALNGSFFRSAVSVVEIYTYLVALRLGRFLRGRRAEGTIAFHPQSAAPWYNIWLAIQLSPFKIISDYENADWIFAFHDSTFSDLAVDKIPGEKKNLLNHRIENIGKDFVADKFAMVFGYSLSIDPLTFRGTAIRKSQENGAHDGVIVECPLAAEEVISGYAYQRLVDSTFNGKTSEDLRISIVLGDMPVVFHKHKAIEKRFGTEYLSVDVLDAEDVFSDDELRNIQKFCEEMGLDFGSIDVMRDKNDGRIYVVDVNKTCMPVLSLSLGQQIKAMRRISRSFSKGLAARRNHAS